MTGADAMLAQLVDSLKTGFIALERKGCPAIP